MGLREQNAARTRRHIAAAAMREFGDRGYDATTMEDVARGADIGLSTLYRYFPTKEQLATAYLGDPGLMGEELRARPVDEPTEVALGQVLLGFIDQVTSTPEEGRIFGGVMEESSRVRARLLEWLGDAHVALSDALTDREGLPAGDVGAAAEAWVAILVLQQATLGSDVDDPTRARDEVVAVMRDLSTRTLRTPRAE
ncbi:TetR/AcrR family transcriptional regulator [Aeromicrobium sp. Leaf350]|uniref:TetR/AcrR family transcriptional regulator n=1 Tax=Aeromicrobium sp. Leaf350 TaxID=2876565 RepID=UPI001E2D3549|nr:TetR/AcrR family transcriptional regulator [Aeromicrobium sp. Leaf350]